MGLDRHPIRTLWVFPFNWHMTLCRYEFLWKWSTRKTIFRPKYYIVSQWEMPTRWQERYLNVIHILRYKLMHCNSWAPLHASRLFLCIQSRSSKPSVNRDKEMGTGLKRLWMEIKRIYQNYVTSSKELRSKLMIDWLSVNTQNFWITKVQFSQLNQNKISCLYIRGGF